ncbi:MAG: hypothetical protein V3R65_01890, partial [Acidiferrobacterales bacterium]
DGIPCDLSILPLNRQDIGKLEVVERLDERHTVCIGNGRNDSLMLEKAVLGIAVILGERSATYSMTRAPTSRGGGRVKFPPSNKFFTLDFPSVALLLPEQHINRLCISA